MSTPEHPSEAMRQRAERLRREASALDERADTVEREAAAGRFTREQIASMSDAEYAKHRDAIMRQQTVA